MTAFLGDGRGGFQGLPTSVTRIGEGHFPVQLLALDADLDGYDDIVVANLQSATVAVLLSQRDGRCLLSKKIIIYLFVFAHYHSITNSRLTLTLPHNASS